MPESSGLRPSGPLARLAAGRPPQLAWLLLLVLVGLTAAATALVPGGEVLALAPAVLAGVLAGVWAGVPGRVLTALGLGAALLAPSGAPAVPPVPTLVGAVLVAATLLASAQLVARCAETVAAARTSAVKVAVAREDDVRAAQTSQQELVGQLHYWSTHDALTGLLNRTAFLRLVETAVAAGQPAGVLIVSVAGFTVVNDELGDPFGDAALVELARRLGGTARAGDVCARVGGDSFGVLLTALAPSAAGAAGERLLHVLDEPFVLGEDATALRARAGVAVVEAGGAVTGRALLRAAERAARSAVVGRAPEVVTGAAPAPAQAEGALTETDLARGIDAGELFLLYQPLVAAGSGHVTAVEALVRWRHPVHGLVPPDAFIGLAERTGLILPLGLRVLQLATAQLAAWSVSAPYLTVAVNVSARQLVEPGFVEDVRRVLWGSRVDPSKVVLELTESLLVDDSEAAVAVLWQLRGLGVRLALDDFGTGYSSLARLGDLPLDEMKIDKSFVDRLGAAPRDSATLVTAAVAMGHGLGLEVVAEGVETAAQAAFLREVGCDLLQGYLMGRPLPAEEIGPLLGRPLLPAPGAFPEPRTATDQMVVPGVLPSLAGDQRRRSTG